jgi:hypothetical protein
MKQKDLALIIVMVFIGAVFGVIASRLLFSQKAKEQTVEVVEPISSDFPAPPSKYFNENSINPTQQIEIGGSTNPTPFNAQSQ